jgi:hypothetical protein
MFDNFIKQINPQPVPDLNMKDPVTEEREKIAKKIQERNIRVLMIHQRHDPARVFGPYWVGPLNITQQDRNHVDGLINRLNMDAITSNKPEHYIYDHAKILTTPSAYLGEWARRIYTKYRILICDIELSPDYDEGVRRGEMDERPYIPAKIEEKTLSYFKSLESGNGLLALLRNYTWQIR